MTTNQEMILSALSVDHGKGTQKIFQECEAIETIGQLSGLLGRLRRDGFIRKRADGLWYREPDVAVPAVDGDSDPISSDSESGDERQESEPVEDSGVTDDQSCSAADSSPEKSDNAPPGLAGSDDKSSPASTLESLKQSASAASAINLVKYMPDDSSLVITDEGVTFVMAGSQYDIQCSDDLYAAIRLAGLYIGDV